MQTMCKPSLSLGLWLHQEGQCSPREVFQGGNLAYCENSWTTWCNPLYGKSLVTFTRVSNSKLKRRVFKISKTKLRILVGAVLAELNLKYRKWICILKCSTTRSNQWLKRENIHLQLIFFLFTHSYNPVLSAIL